MDSQQAPPKPARISIGEFEAMLRGSLPMISAWGVETIALEHGKATLRLAGGAEFLRPGGTVSGPVLMGLADVALYAALLGAIGPVPLAVTSNLTINFLRKPGPGDIRAEARILKLGRRLAVGEVHLFSGEEAEMVAHVVSSYAIPDDGAPDTRSLAPSQYRD
jgi:uncharacterized protein (TIGR00369 family)